VDHAQAHRPAFISLDGVMQAPGAQEEDPDSGSNLGGWATPYDDEAIGQSQQDLFAEPFELLMGRRTYDLFASFPIRGILRKVRNALGQ
jgi:dihydrofolate reductase